MYFYLILVLFHLKSKLKNERFNKNSKPGLKFYENYEIYKKKIKLRLTSQGICKKMTGDNEKTGNKAGRKRERDGEKY